MIFFVESCFRPVIGLAISERIRGINSISILISCDNIIVGAIFWIVEIIIHIVQSMACIRVGSHKCIGIMPIFINILIVNKILVLRGDSKLEFIKIDINIIEDEHLWIIRYFIT